MSTTTLDNAFDFSSGDERAAVLVSELEAPYVEAVVRDEVKNGIDRTIEKYSTSKALLELIVLSVPLCLEINKTTAEKRSADDITDITTK